MFQYHISFKAGMQENVTNDPGIVMKADNMTREGDEVLFLEEKSIVGRIPFDNILYIRQQPHDG